MTVCQHEILLMPQYLCVHASEWCEVTSTWEETDLNDSIHHFWWDRIIQPKR